MGLISGACALVQIARIRKGKLGKLSISQITQMIVNMPDARKNLDNATFEKVCDIYKQLRKCKVKRNITPSEYISVATCIVRLFHSQAPYEKFSGADPAETASMLEEIRQTSELENRDFEYFLERVQLEAARSKNRKAVMRLLLSALFCAAAWIIADYYVEIKYDQAFSNGYNSGYDDGYQTGYDYGVLKPEIVYCDNVLLAYHSEDCMLRTDVCYEKTKDEAIEMGYDACWYCIGEEVKAAYEDGYSDGYEDGWDGHKQLTGG